jgi:PAS domain S-box-containing protein
MEARRFLRWLGPILLLAGAYTALVRLGLLFSPAGGFASVVWPASGLAFASLYLWGARLWPGIALGAFIGNFTAGATIPVALGIALGNSLEAIVGCLLMQRAQGARRGLGRLFDVAVFAGLVALLSTAIAATIGAGALYAGGIIGRELLGLVWSSWWLGDAIGVLIVAPLPIVWTMSDGAELVGTANLRRRVVEGVALAVAIAAITFFVFADPRTGLPFRYPYAVFPVLIWAAARFGQRGASAGMLLISVIAVWQTYKGYGPFAGEEVHQGLLLLQAFMGVAALTGMVLGAGTTERQEAQARTKDLAEAQAISRVGSWEWDIVADRIEWSDELYRIFGIGREGFRASYDAYLQRIHPEDRAELDQVIKTAHQQKEPFRIEHRVVRPDGSIRYVFGQGRVEVDESGQALRMVGTAQDITEQKLAHQERLRLAQAEEAVRLRDEFISIAAHELRTPLTALLLQIQGAARASGKDQARITTLLDQARRSTERLGRLVESLLDVSRLSTGRMRLDRERFDLAEALAEVVERLKGTAAEKGSEIRWHADAATGDWDRLRVEQVIVNLLSNALNYGRGQPIEVSTGVKDGWAEISVSDSGPGIGSDEAARIFHRFQRGEAARGSGGLGLGLYISRQVVEAHGGTITVENRPEGGARFVVRLPRS